MATTIRITSLTSTETSISMSCNVTSQYAASGLYVRMRLNGPNGEYKDSSRFSMQAGQSRAVSVRMTGLEPDTYYEVEAILYNSSGQVVKDMDSIWTDVAAQGPTEYGSITVTDVGYDYISIRLERIPEATSYVIAYRVDGSSSTQNVRVTTLNATIQGLSPETTYVINYYGQNSDGVGPFMPRGEYVTTLSKPKPPTASGTLTVTEVGKTTIKVRLTAIPLATSYIIAYRPTSTSVQQEVTTTSLAYTLSGLLPGTTYYLNYRGQNNDGVGPFGSTITAKTLGAVDPWDWSASNGTASAAQTRAAYQAVTNQGKLSEFSYLVWNDMVSKVKQIIDARSTTWNSDYGSINATNMTSSDRAITALRYNALWWNLSHFVTVSGGKRVAQGDKILGSYFTALTNAMNKSIP